jgi:hypothetical protein
MRPAAAILGKAVKKRAASVAADPSACCDNGLHGQLTNAKICHRRRIRRQSTAWQGGAAAKP